jgi:hypothetical protein
MGYALRLWDLPSFHHLAHFPGHLAMVIQRWVMVTSMTMRMEMAIISGTTQFLEVSQLRILYAVNIYMHHN